MATNKKMKKVPAAPTERTGGDIVHSALKAVIGPVPFAAEIFETAITAPSEKRLSNWRQLVTATVNRLIDEHEELTPEKLGNNEAFVTAVMATSQSAMLTTRRAKLELLQSVIYTTGSGLVLDEFLRDTFLSAIQRYTPEHVWLLRRCADQEYLKARFEKHKTSEIKDTGTGDTSYGIVIEKLVPTLLPELREDIAEELFRDLHRDRFCHGSEGFAFTFKPDQAVAVTTVRGKEFLKFIFGGADYC